MTTMRHDHRDDVTCREQALLATVAELTARLRNAEDLIGAFYSGDHGAYQWANTHLEEYARVIAADAMNRAFDADFPLAAWRTVHEVAAAVRGIGPKAATA